MMSAPSDIERLTHIRARLTAGTLPRCTENPKVYGGYGEDQTCDCCGDPIQRKNVAYEVELQNSPDPKTLAMHLQCFGIWVEESRKQKLERGPQPSEPEAELRRRESVASADSI